jgi:hypothetical protein
MANFSKLIVSPISLVAACQDILQIAVLPIFLSATFCKIWTNAGKKIATKYLTLLIYCLPDNYQYMQLS